MNSSTVLQVIFGLVLENKPTYINGQVGEGHEWNWRCPSCGGKLVQALVCHRWREENTIWLWVLMMEEIVDQNTA